jgi:hypothetical protein
VNPACQRCGNGQPQGNSKGGYKWVCILSKRAELIAGENLTRGSNKDGDQCRAEHEQECTAQPVYGLHLEVGPGGEEQRGRNPREQHPAAAGPFVPCNQHKDREPQESKKGAEEGEDGDKR